MSQDSSESSTTGKKQIRYIYELPYQERKLLCQALDIHNKWEELGGVYMKFDYAVLFQVSQAVLRYRSPTEELLNLWGSQNHTILELFRLFWKMKHFQAMKILKPFIDPEYHYLIYEGENNIQFSQTCEAKPTTSATVTSPTVKKEKSISYPRKIGSNEPSHDQIPPTLKESEINTEKHPNANISTERKVSDAGLDACTPLIPYKELELATNFWDKTNILGRGGFGVVFKGIWKNTAVAIKRLELQKGNELEYNVLEVQRQQSDKELKYLNSYRHDNILPLYGFSIGGEKPCLIYQFMPNGSLDDRLQCRQKTKPLTWAERGTIATGTARGLQFLHGMEKPLVHGDIKSANILLDHHLEPKIGDFGLAREGPVQQYTHVKVTRVHGTRPYLPDEFLRGKKFSTKVDTYSFGVVLFEIATGLKVYDESRSEKFLKDHVENYEDSKILDLLDLKAGTEDDNFFLHLLSIGKKCISHRPKDRPDMVEVLKQLDGMLASKELVNRAKNNIRQNSMMNPSNPLEAQMIYDYHAARRLSIASPSGSFHPQPWLFASPAASKQLLHIARSSSPTHPGTTVASQPYQGLPQVLETSCDDKMSFENFRPHEANLPHIRVNEVNPPVMRFEAAPNRPVPDVRVNPPQISVQPSSVESSTISDTSSSLSSTEQDISKSTNTNTAKETASPLTDNADDYTPMITELMKGL